jgi:hypothetical protein
MKFTSFAAGAALAGVALAQIEYVVNVSLPK